MGFHPNTTTTTTTLFFLSQILIYFAHQLATAQFDRSQLYYNCSNSNSNLTNNSIYRTNVDRALSDIASNINTTSGFLSTSIGSDPDRTHALALCRGDIDPVSCGQRVHNSTLRLREVCPDAREAIIWYDDCMSVYSNRSSTLTDINNSLGFYMRNTANITNITQFNDGLMTLFNDLRTRAADGGPLLKFAMGNVTNPEVMDIYGLMQCTPNLSDDDCNRCLSLAMQTIPGCCNGRRGGRVIQPSCNLRFEVYPFFQATPQPFSPPPPLPPFSPPPPLPSFSPPFSPPPPLPPFSPPPPLPSFSPPPPLPSFSPPFSSPPPGENDETTRTVVTIVVPIIIFVFILVVVMWILISKRKKRKPNELLFDATDVDDDISMLESLQHDLETIRTATNFFSDSNKLGQGGFGAVYKGRFQNGLEIAVKRLSENSAQGEIEFKNEVVLLAKLQHRNLVRLLGFCLQGIERLLIYEFVPNVSLDHFIFDEVNRVGLDWDRRYKIIGGVARGLLYLHEDSRHRIIHRDLKASNILLDKELNAKIADFGMARLCKRDETQGNTTRIVGTYGYMAPEYAMHGQFSVKSDVFSFGVLVLEIVSGQRNNCFRNGENIVDLLSYAWKNWQEERVMDMVDPILRSNTGTVPDIEKCIHIGLLCVQENIVDRPTMATVISMFNTEYITLPIPSQTAFFMHGNNNVVVPGNPSTGESANASVNDMSLSEIYPR